MTPPQTPRAASATRGQAHDQRRACCGRCACELFYGIESTSQPFRRLVQVKRTIITPGTGVMMGRHRERALRALDSTARRSGHACASLSAGFGCTSGGRHRTRGHGRSSGAPHGLLGHGASRGRASWRHGRSSGCGRPLRRHRCRHASGIGRWHRLARGCLRMREGSEQGC